MDSLISLLTHDSGLEIKRCLRSRICYLRGFYFLVLDKFLFNHKSSKMLSQAQKSFYAGQRQSSYPQVLAKYKTTTESLINRVGDSTDSETVDSSSPVPTQSEYDKFIQRISSWPEDKQPFWFKNRQAITAMINQTVDAGNGAQVSGEPVRSPFAG